MQTHVCMVKADTETGKSEITGYVTVGNRGPVVDPAIVEGQPNDDIARVIA
jgi:CO/xanthine dehydrogenase Mo-binding subunit